jgi:hypothetical protein
MTKPLKFDSSNLKLYSSFPFELSHEEIVVDFTLRIDIKQLLQISNTELFSRPLLLFANDFVVDRGFDGVDGDESMDEGFAGLSNAMDSSDRLKFLVGVEDRFDEEDVCGFDQRETFSSELQVEHQASDVLAVVLEILNMLREIS